MAGLEALYASARAAVSRPQDALLCGLHWELVRHGYRCLGAGEQPRPDERKSELLPAGWEANKEVYTLRYKSTDDARELLLKAIMVEDSMIVNVMDRTSQKVADVTLAVADYVNPEHLDDFHKVYKNMEELRTKIASGIIAPLGGPAEKDKKEPEAEKEPVLPKDYDPLRAPPRQPAGTRAPSCCNPFWPQVRDAAVAPLSLGNRLWLLPCMAPLVSSAPLLSAGAQGARCSLGRPRTPVGRQAGAGHGSETMLLAHTAGKEL